VKTLVLGATGMTGQHAVRILLEDLATFMVQQLKSDEWVRKSPLIGY
jgi:uncharacterized protein YbjT (DUF2867 family)